MSDNLTVTPENAPNFRDWIANRGGLLVWESVDLSNPGASWTTPALTADGTPTPKPHWGVADKPARHITDARDVVVSVDKEVKRFHVAVRSGSQGLLLKVTDGGTRRIYREIEKAGPGAYYVFDYSDYENCIILAPEKTIPLSEFQS